MAAIANAGADMYYIITGQKIAVAPSAEEAPAWALIDGEKLGRIIEMLEAAAKQAGRRWPSKKLKLVINR
ncbi:hypothetical protein ACEN9D_26310 [Pseudomonas sp. CT11-2]|uniref:hypothetical protein n=1 Tax=unclassified Pseudomonas TaxID=196821 RepID=UPI00215FB055|nr:hypothetical protein [Pseudomonas sp. B21-019]UVM35467.1 hypothetical protein LOY36_12460 [Pseudomonas sp. B21-019]